MAMTEERRERIDPDALLAGIERDLADAATLREEARLLRKPGPTGIVKAAPAIATAAPIKLAELF